jgi:hypothetical protein
MKCGEKQHGAPVALQRCAGSGPWRRQSSSLAKVPQLQALKGKAEFSEEIGYWHLAGPLGERRNHWRQAQNM